MAGLLLIVVFKELYNEQRTSIENGRRIAPSQPLPLLRPLPGENPTDDPRWQQALTEAKQFCDWLRDLYADEKDHYGLVRAPEKEDLLHEVSTVLRRQTVLFMSYNLADPDFNLLWRAVRARAGRFARTAYAVWPSLPEGEVRIWRDRGIVVLNTDPLGV